MPKDFESIGKRRFLNGLDEPEKTMLAESAHTVRYAAGQMVFESGDESDCCYVVVEGRVRIVRFSEEGDEITLGYIDRGEIFGEMSVLDGGARSASAYAHSAATLGVIPGARLRAFLEDNPRLTVELFSLVCRRLRNTIDQLDTIAFEPLEARLARLLLMLSETYGVDHADGVLIDFRLGHRELGAFIATSRESVGKQLTRWSKAAIVAREDGRFLLRDVAALEDLAGRTV